MTDEAGGDASRPGEHRAALLARVRRGADPGPRPSAPQPADHPVPLSAAQRTLWFLDRLAPGLPTYNVPYAAQLTGPVDVEALRLALADTVARHEPLRTGLHEQDGEPVQRVRGEVPVLLPVHEAASSTEDAVRTFVREPFDLASAPLWRAALWRTGPDEHLLVIVVHHVVFDGWSADVLIRDLSAFYRLRTAGPGEAAAPDPLPIRYADYVDWQTAWLDRNAGRLEEYWRGRLAALPTVEFPTDRPRPATAGYAGAALRTDLADGLAAGVHALAQASGVTPYAVYLTALFILLHRYANQDDLVVGTPIANRGRVQTEPLVGFFVNMLVLRADLAGDPTGSALLRAVGATAAEALDHGDLPFERLVDVLAPPRDPSRSPLFQISFGLLDAPELPDLPGVEARTVPVDPGVARFDLAWNLTDAPGGLGLSLEYNSALFDEATAWDLARHYERLLHGLVADPDTPVSRLPLLGEQERAAMLGRWNGPELPFADATVPALFEAWVRRTPDAVALLVGGVEHTYAALNRRADRLAAWLRGRGAGPGTTVALCLPREAELIVAMLAVLKSGAAYVPIDPAYPPARMAAILADAAPQLVLTDPELVGRLPADAPPTLVLDAVAAASLDAAPEADGATVSLTDESGTGGPAGPSVEDTAYVIYTSGTTGTPKGVPIDHRSVVAFTAGVTDLFDLGPEDRVLGYASANFDVSVFEIFGALLNGARLCLVRDAERLSAEALQDLIGSAGVTVTDLPPTVMALLDPGRFPALRIVFVGGEAFPGELVNTWNRGRRLYNGYGPTECTVTMIVYECRGRFDGSPPIGLPMANHVAHVVDRHLEPLPYGVAGELVIGGVTLTRGYLHAPELTAAKIVPDPFGTAPGGRLYHTGDLVKRLRDGNLVFLGRVDRQTKIRGLRIEPGDVEAALATHPRVGQVTVQTWADPSGEKHLVAYVSAKDAGAAAEITAPPLDVRELRAHAADRLPPYMVPSYIVLLDALPLTVSGKVDARALPDPDDSARAGSATPGSAAPATETERVLAEELFAGLLGLPSVGVHDNFFELGGNSLRTVRLMSAIRGRFGVEIGLAEFFQAPTVTHLAAAIDRARAASMPDDELLALIEGLPPEELERLLGDGPLDAGFGGASVEAS